MTLISAGQALGINLKRVREQAGDTQTDTANKAREFGLNWRHSHVSAFENGRRASVTVEELLVLSSIYGVALSEWFAGDSTVIVTPQYAIPEADIAEALKGKWSGAVLDFSNAEDYSADESIAQRLKLEQDTVTAIAMSLWGRSATAERDERLKDHQNKKPSEMRNLRSGMTKHLAHQIKLHIEKESR